MLTKKAIRIWAAVAAVGVTTLCACGIFSFFLFSGISVTGKWKTEMITEWSYTFESNGTGEAVEKSGRQRIGFTYKVKRGDPEMLEIQIRQVRGEFFNPQPVEGTFELYRITKEGDFMILTPEKVVAPHMGVPFNLKRVRN